MSKYHRRLSAVMFCLAVVLTGCSDTASLEVPIEPVEDRSFDLGNTPGDVQKILTNQPVSESQLNTQQTPIDVSNGRVYTTNIEIGPEGDGKGLPQKTVLRQAIQNDNGEWDWKATTIDDQTVFNKWHTAPAVGVDKSGYVHVVYNMHYSPWQYKRSTVPHQIDDFAFRGQKISKRQRNKAINENDIDFPTLGYADIPGNQITYPAFYKDRNRELFISYRFTATPKRRFTDRTASAGIASYDIQSKKWKAYGGEVPLTKADFKSFRKAPKKSIALAGELGWTAYHPRLLFDEANQLLVHWYWRLGTGGGRSTRPCLVVVTDNPEEVNTLDGNTFSTPVTPDDCGNLAYPNDKEFLTIGNATIDSNGVPYLLLSPVDEPRAMIHYNKALKQWIHETAPFGATEIFFDKKDTLWAISSGLRIFKRERGSQVWQTVYDEGEKNNCYPSAIVDESGDNAFIHSQACDGKSITIYSLSLYSKKEPDES